MESYRELDVWQNGIKLMKEIHSITKKLPAEERYDGVFQIKKATKSVLANVAEGCGRYTYKDKASKFVMARGECYEVEAFLYIFLELQYVSESDVVRALELIQIERKLLSGLISSCRKKHLSLIHR